MRRLLQFQALRIKHAWRGCWTRANEQATLLGGVILTALLWLASPSLQEKGMIEAPSTHWGVAAYALGTAVASVILAFGVIFVGRWLLAPSRLYWAERDRADEIERNWEALTDKIAHSLRIVAQVHANIVNANAPTLEWRLTVKNSASAPIEYGTFSLQECLEGQEPIARSMIGGILAVGGDATYVTPFTSKFTEKEGLLTVAIIVEYGNVGRPPSRRLTQEMEVKFHPRGVLAHSSCHNSKYEDVPL